MVAANGAEKGGRENNGNEEKGNKGIKGNRERKFWEVCTVDMRQMEAGSFL